MIMSTTLPIHDELTKQEEPEIVDIDTLRGDIFGLNSTITNKSVNLNPFLTSNNENRNKSSDGCFLVNFEKKLSFGSDRHILHDETSNEEKVQNCHTPTTTTPSRFKLHFHPSHTTPCYTNNDKLAKLASPSNVNLLEITEDLLFGLESPPSPPSQIPPVKQILSTIDNRQIENSPVLQSRNKQVGEKPIMRRTALTDSVIQQTLQPPQTRISPICASPCPTSEVAQLNRHSTSPMDSSPMPVKKKISSPISTKLRPPSKNYSAFSQISHFKSSLCDVPVEGSVQKPTESGLGGFMIKRVEDTELHGQRSKIPKLSSSPSVLKDASAELYTSNIPTSTSTISHKEQKTAFRKKETPFSSFYPVPNTGSHGNSKIENTSITLNIPVELLASASQSLVAKNTKESSFACSSMKKPFFAPSKNTPLFNNSTTTGSNIHTPTKQTNGHFTFGSASMSASNLQFFPHSPSSLSLYKRRGIGNANDRPFSPYKKW